MSPERTEWAVIERGFRGVTVLKGGLGSAEEAEAWRAALLITRKRTTHEHFMATDGIVMHGEMEVASRVVGGWRSLRTEALSEEQTKGKR